jgi:hypothetical protein
MYHVIAVGYGKSPDTHGCHVFDDNMNSIEQLKTLPKVLCSPYRCTPTWQEPGKGPRLSRVSLASTTVKPKDFQVSGLRSTVGHVINIIFI